MPSGPGKGILAGACLQLRSTAKEGMLGGKLGRLSDVPAEF